MNVKVKWSKPIDDWAVSVIARNKAKINSVIRETVEVYVPQVEAWMKQNATWQDQTGDARRKLRADLLILSGQYYTVLLQAHHGVFYGKYLEYNHQGRFSIINPAIQYWGPIIFNHVQRALK